MPLLRSIKAQGAALAELQTSQEFIQNKWTG